MGRLITYDNVVLESLNTLIKNKVVQTGLIIGQSTPQKDIVLRLCPTPMKDEIEGEEDSLQKSKQKTAANDIDESWICQHAKQLVRALPGGLDILGLYIVAPSDFTVKNQALLRQVLFAIYKIKSLKGKILRERILLNICSITSKILCRTFDVSDYKSSATPAEWKSQNGPQKWHRLRCHLAVDVKFPHEKAEINNLSLQTQMELSLKNFFENIQNAVLLFNGQKRNMDDALAISVEGKRSKKKQSERTEHLSEWFDVELFIPLGNDVISSPEIFTATSMMTFRGIMQCRAYIHAKATVQEAVDAIKQDIARSLISRCEIHCEDLLLIEEEQSDPLVVHELPRRVFAPLPQMDVCVCDYQFHNDAASDSLDAFKELLNLELTEEDIDTSCEVSPTTRALILPDAAEDKLSEFGDAPVQSSSMRLAPIIGVVSTIAVGLTAYVIKTQWS
ncbi:protein odr-4 homolog [Parasteatoda tepidariorum]|uniref:protein odr-4 homolog n=1 Tax=Parasteatoda tepidariorum TaxID=114398 RepID=UPI0039BD4632